MLSIDRKQSAEIENESLEIVLKLGSTISVDIRPDFLRNEKERIFSNTRSILQISLNDKISISINNNTLQKIISGDISIAYYFLVHNDREVGLNPLVIRDSQQLS